MKKIIYIIFPTIISVLAIPVLAAPQTTFAGLINETIIKGILGPLVPLLISLAVVIFLYGVIVLIFSEGGEKKEEGKQYMLWGIIGIFVMVSVWGLVNLLKGQFGLDNVAPRIQLKVPGQQTQDWDASTNNDGIRT